MKVSRKKINNILIYYGGTVILILIFFYFFYKKYENFYGAPKSKGVKVGNNVPVSIKPVQMAATLKLSTPNQVAICLNGQYRDTTQANSTLFQKAKEVKQYGVVNTINNNSPINNIIYIKNKNKFKNYIKNLKEPTLNSLISLMNNIIINLPDWKQNIIWEKIVPDWPKNNIDIDDNEFKEYISNFDINKLYILPKNIMDNLSNSKQNIIYKKIVPTWSKDKIISLNDNDYKFLNKFMTDEQKKKN